MTDRPTDDLPVPHISDRALRDAEARLLANDNRPTDDLPFGPGHPEWCPVGKPEADEAHMHCSHWDNCEPCCRCGDDTPDPNCDCDRCTEARTT